MTKLKKQMNKYVFIDTSIFLDVLYSNTSSEYIDKILKELSDNKMILLLPKVIQMEILKDFTLWKKDLLEGITQKLEIDLILDVTDKDKVGTGKSKKKKSDNLSLIDGITKKTRTELIKNVSDFYQKIQTKLNSIFTSKNTKIIELSDTIIIKGIERSLLKKAPSTKLDKKTEHQHLKDVDCIAFESILCFLGGCKLSREDIFYIFTSDDDYLDEDNLREDIKKDLPKFKNTNIKHSQSIGDLFVKKQGGKRVVKNKTEASLLGELNGLVESVEKQTNNVVKI